MKLSKLLKFVVGALGIVAFIMMFTDQLSIEIFGQKGTGKFDEVLSKCIKNTSSSNLVKLGGGRIENRNNINSSVNFPI